MTSSYEDIPGRTKLQAKFLDPEFRLKVVHKLWPDEFPLFDDFVETITIIQIKANEKLSEYEEELSRFELFKRKESLKFCRDRISYLTIQLSEYNDELSGHKEMPSEYNKENVKLYIKETRKEIEHYENESKKLEEDIDMCGKESESANEKLELKEYLQKIEKVESQINKERYICSHKDVLTSKIQSVDTWFSYVEMEHHEWNVAFSALGMSNIVEEKIDVESKILVDCEPVIDDSFTMILRRMKAHPFNVGDRRILLFDEFKLMVISFEDMKKFFSLSGIYVLKMSDLT